LLQSRQRFDEAMHSYWTAIQFRPRLAGKWLGIFMCIHDCSMEICVCNCM
jgi:hypothetical protein